MIIESLSTHHFFKFVFFLLVHFHLPVISKWKALLHVLVLRTSTFYKKSKIQAKEKNSKLMSGSCPSRIRNRVLKRPDVENYICLLEKKKNLFYNRQFA